MLAALGDGKLFSVQCEVILHFAGAAGPGDDAEFRATTTYCQIDPKERLVAIAFAQHFPTTSTTSSPSGPRLNIRR